MKREGRDKGGGGRRRVELGELGRGGRGENKEKDYGFQNIIASHSGTGRREASQPAANYKADYTRGHV